MHKSNLKIIHNLKTLRQLQIIWLVADLEHHGHFNRNTVDLNSIQLYLSKSTNSIKKYASLYTRW